MFLHFDRCFPKSFFTLNLEALLELDRKSIRERDIISVSAKYHGHIWSRTKEKSCWSIVRPPASNGMLMLQLFSLSNNKLCLLFPRTDLLLRRFSETDDGLLKIASKWPPLPHALDKSELFTSKTRQLFKETMNCGFIGLPLCEVQCCLCASAQQTLCFLAVKPSGSPSPVVESSETGGVKPEDSVGCCWSRYSSSQLTQWLSPELNPPQGLSHPCTAALTAHLVMFPLLYQNPLLAPLNSDRKKPRF